MKEATLADSHISNDDVLEDIGVVVRVGSHLVLERTLVVVLKSYAEERRVESSSYLHSLNGR